MYICDERYFKKMLHTKKKKNNNNPTKWKVITFESLPIFDSITTITVFGNFNKIKNTFNLHLII